LLARAKISKQLFGRFLEKSAEIQTSQLQIPAVERSISQRPHFVTLENQIYKKFFGTFFKKGQTGEE